MNENDELTARHILAAIGVAVFLLVAAALIIPSKAEATPEPWSSHE